MQRRVQSADLKLPMNIDTDCLEDVETDNFLNSSNGECSSTKSAATKKANMKMARAAMKRYHSVKSPEKRPKGFFYLKLETGLDSPEK